MQVGYLQILVVCYEIQNTHLKMLRKDYFLAPNRKIVIIAIELLTDYLYNMVIYLNQKIVSKK